MSLCCEHPPSSGLGENFLKYMEVFAPYLKSALLNHTEIQVITTLQSSLNQGCNTVTHPRSVVWGSGGVTHPHSVV